MSTIPPKPEDAMAWLQAHIDKWGLDPTGVGLSELDLTELQAELDAAQSAMALTVARREASKAATAGFDAKIKAMRDVASLKVSRIRTFARGSANPQAVYELAEIPAPAKPSETPPPATPTDFRVKLLNNGALRFTFKCANPKRARAVTYKVERQDGPQLPFTFLTNAKNKTFDDATFPASSNLIFYRVTAQTATRDGEPAGFTVRYGAGNQSGAGQATILSQGTVTESQAS